jgi:hypothetical protein
MKKKLQKKSTWYEEVFDSTDLPNSTPELDPYVNVDKYPDWVAKVLVELLSQNMPAIPLKELRVITPEKLGRFLGQKCANIYALGERFQIGLQNPQNIAKGVELFNRLQSQKVKPGVSSLLHATNITSKLIADFSKDVEQVENNVLEAFKSALDQPSYKEAVEFFQGFAKGLSKKGITLNGMARETTATPVYEKMFFHWQEVDRLRSVPQLKAFLLKNGLTEAIIGDISRLRRLCTRIGYAPGKRGRPPKSEK